MYAARLLTTGVCLSATFVLSAGALAQAVRTTVRTDAGGIHLERMYGVGEDAPPPIARRGGGVIWRVHDNTSISNSVALADTNDETWVAHNLNSERLAHHVTTGDGTPTYEFSIAAESPDLVAVASAEDVSLGVMLTNDPNDQNLVRAFTADGGAAPIWTYTFPSQFPSVGFRALDVSEDGSIVAAIASDVVNDAAFLVILNGADGSVLQSGDVCTPTGAALELSGDGSRAVLTLGGTATVVRTDTLATLFSFTVSGAGGFHRISRDGTVVAAGGFNYRAFREGPGGGWTQIVNSSQASNWFGGGIGLSGDGSTMFVVSGNFATGWLLLTYRVIDLTSGAEIASIITQGSGSFQDTPQLAQVSDDGSVLAVGSWGTQDNAHPEVQVFDRDLNLIGSVDTPGSVFDIDLSRDGRFVAVGSKSIHANTFGRGSNTYAFDVGVDCPGDITGDGQVALDDLGILLSNFGTPSGATPDDGDLNGDGAVDLADLALLLSAFGTVCS